MKKRIRNGILLLLCSVIAGSLLLTFIFSLPVEPARRHVSESLYEMIDIEEDPAGDVWRKKIVSLKDSFTDCLMVQNALERVDGKGPWSHAMYIYHHDLQDDTDTTWRTEESLGAFFDMAPDDMYLKEYSRYWHGYLVFLKPLLLCMSWRHVETLLVIFHIVLLFAVIISACYKGKASVGAGIFFTLLFMKPLRIWFSLTLSTCWSITLLAVLVLLWFFERLEERNWQEEFFLLVGITTSYMDFLTYPIVTLGVPLCVWLLLSQESERKWHDNLFQAFWNCVCWAAGYIGMWGMKWVVAEITCRTGTLRNAAWAVLFRTSPLDGYASFSSGIGRTFRAVMEQYDTVVYGIVFGLIAAAAVLAFLWCLVRARSASWGICMVCLSAAALFPLGWLILTQNHTAIHCEFTFRIMGVTVMALWSIASSSLSAVRSRSRAANR